MKTLYLTAAALAVGLLAAQPVLAQSEAHEADPYAVHKTTPHKKHNWFHHKKKPAPSVTPTDNTKTQ